MNILTSLDVYVLTDTGLKRSRNEDSTHILIPPPGVDQEKAGALFMVADGMGGLGGGDVASRTAIDEVARGYYEDRNQNLMERLKSALQVASNHVREQAPRVGLKTIGSTAAGLILTPVGDALIFNVGDCRVYRVREGNIERVSHDQSLMEMRIEEGMNPEQAAQETNASLVTGFLGQPTPLAPVIKAEPAITNDIFIVCSDGLWSLIKPAEILKIVQKSPAKHAVQRLIALALKRGAPDNVTVMVVRVGKAPSTLPIPAIAGAVIAFLIVLSVLIFALSGTFARPTPTLTPTAVTPTSTVGPQLQVLPTFTP